MEIMVWLIRLVVILPHLFFFFFTHITIIRDWLDQSPSFLLPNKLKILLFSVNRTVLLSFLLWYCIVLKLYFLKKKLKTKKTHQLQPYKLNSFKLIKSSLAAFIYTSNFQSKHLTMQPLQLWSLSKRYMSPYILITWSLSLLEVLVIRKN